MEIYLYRPGAEQIEQSSNREALAEMLADKRNVVWVDLGGETAADIALAEDVLIKDFNFHYLTVEDAIETRHEPKIEGFPDYLYFIVHGVKPERTRPSNFATKELDGYLGRNFVVTFHRENFRSLEDVKKQILSSTFACQRGPAYLLHQILDRLVDFYMPLVDDFDVEINAIEVRVLAMKKSDNGALGEIMNVRRAVARLKRISARQLQVLYRISHGEFPQIPKDVLPYYRDVHDHLLRIVDLAEAYRDLVSGLFDIHFAVVANRTNDVMKTLAVLSAIILPLSLIAGIYGMNFDYMPELKTRFGYFITLGGMALLTIALLFYFWKRGWIFQGESSAISEDPPATDRDHEDS